MRVTPEEFIAREFTMVPGQKAGNASDWKLNNVNTKEVPLATIVSEWDDIRQGQKKTKRLYVADGETSDISPRLVTELEQGGMRFPELFVGSTAALESYVRNGGIRHHLAPCFLYC